MKFPWVVDPQNQAGTDFAHEVHLFWIMSPDYLFFQKFNFVPGASWEFQVCPAEAFNPYSSTFRWIEFFGSESSDTQPWTFLSSQNSNWSLSTFFSASRWVSSHHHVDTSNDSHECICFQTCNHGTRDDVESCATIFFILTTVDKGFSASIEGLAFGLFKLSTSVCVFTFGTEEDARSRWDLLCVSPLHPTLSSRSPVACVCIRKLQASLLEQDPSVFRSKHSSVFHSIKKMFALFVFSRLYTGQFRRSSKENRSTMSILPPPSNPTLRFQRNLFLQLILDWWSPSASWLLRSLDPLQYEREILRFCTNFNLEIHDPALKFLFVSEFLQMYLRGETTRNCHATRAQVPTPTAWSVTDTRDFLSSRLFLLALTEKRGKSTNCNGSSLPPLPIPSVLSNDNDFAKDLESLWNSSESRRACRVKNVSKNTQILPCIFAHSHFAARLSWTK